nr:MAG TPA: hypothetical protein [Caudoviricetes sp.]
MVTVSPITINRTDPITLSTTLFALRLVKPVEITILFKRPL